MGFIFPLRRHLTGLRARRPKEQGGASLEDEQQNRIIWLVTVINAEYFLLSKYNHINPRFFSPIFPLFFHRKTAGRYPPAHNEILERDAMEIIRVL